MIYWLVRWRMERDRREAEERAAIAAEAKRVADEIRTHLARCRI